MLRIFILFITLSTILSSCSSEEDPPCYPFSKDELSWFSFNIGDTLTFQELNTKKTLVFVANRNDSSTSKTTKRCLMCKPPICDLYKTLYYNSLPSPNSTYNYQIILRLQKDGDKFYVMYDINPNGNSTGGGNFNLSSSSSLGSKSFNNVVINDCYFNSGTSKPSCPYCSDSVIISKKYGVLYFKSGDNLERFERIL